MPGQTQEIKETRKKGPLILPDDEHNRALLKNTHPDAYVNPEPAEKYHMVVIGAGTAGIVSAASCASLGGRVALIERHLTGGDCLVAGCVPSKGVISASRIAAHVRNAADFGIKVPPGTTVDFPTVMARMRKLRTRISDNDSIQSFQKLGIDVFIGNARFSSRNSVEVGGKTLRFARSVIATGGRAAVPPIPGLKEAGYLTNENIFWLTELPRRLAIIGAGPIGAEMAQSFRRFGSEVTLINQAPQILHREDDDAAAIVQRVFVKEGIRLCLSAKIERVEQRGQEKVLVIQHEGKRHEIPCDAILVSAGRVPNTEGLGLEAAGVAYDKKGVTVTDQLQTTNPRIFGVGDISAPFKFTHTASALARVALMNSFFFGRQKMSSLVVPWCTYTDPEIAHVGLYEKQAKEMGYEVATFTEQLSENDRAILEGETDGFVRVHLKKGSDKILGATIVATHAGEMLNVFTLAMTSGKGLSSLGNMIYSYPTQSEIIKRVANSYMATKLTPTIKKLLGFIVRFRR